MPVIFGSFSLVLFRGEFKAAFEVLFKLTALGYYSQLKLAPVNVRVDEVLACFTPSSGTILHSTPPAPSEPL